MYLLMPSGSRFIVMGQLQPLHGVVLDVVVVVVVGSEFGKLKHNNSDFEGNEDNADENEKEIHCKNMEDEIETDEDRLDDDGEDVEEGNEDENNVVVIWYNCCYL